MTWQQRSEGLDPLSKAKGSHTGSGGIIAYSIVVKSFNKRVIFFEQYFENVSGEMFADFIHKYFKKAFEKKPQSKGKNLSSGWWFITKQQKGE